MLPFAFKLSELGLVVLLLLFRPRAELVLGHAGLTLATKVGEVAHLVDLQEVRRTGRGVGPSRTPRGSFPTTLAAPTSPGAGRRSNGTSRGRSASARRTPGPT